MPELVERIEARDFIGDRAYDTNNMLDYLASRSMNVVIPPKINRRVQRAYDKEKYKTRHFVENLFQKLKRFRRVATRYDKTSRSFAAFMILAAVYIITKTAKSVLREVTISGVARTTAEVYVPEGARWNLPRPFNPTTRLAGEEFPHRVNTRALGGVARGFTPILGEKCRGRVWKGPLQMAFCQFRYCQSRYNEGAGPTA